MFLLKKTAHEQGGKTMADEMTPKEALTVVKGGIIGFIILTQQMQAMMTNYNDFNAETHKQFNAMLDQLRKTAEETEQAIPAIEEGIKKE